MQVVVLTEAPFPFGLGATNRILSYARGFVESGCSVTVLVLRPTASRFSGPSDTPMDGAYHRVDYVNCSGALTRPDRLFTRFHTALKGLLSSLLTVWRLHSASRIDSFILVSNSAVDILVFFVISRLLRVTYVQEKSEYPFVLRNKSSLGRLYATIYTKYIYRVFDGLIVMTNALNDYFAPRLRKNAKLIVVPMTVEVDRFARCHERSPAAAPYVAYCGDMSGEKDGVNVLISAFAAVAGRHPALRLYLIGDASDPSEFRGLKEQVAELGLGERVIFTGRIDREAIPPILCGATALALARPSTLQSKGGFPTKLGEYLATGRPVVVTRVGEINQYLKDGVDVFFTEPDSHEAFAEKLDYVLSNLEFAKVVGASGQKVAQAEFDYKPQSRRLLDFIEAL